MIRQVKSQDAPSICLIYNYYIANSIITFEEDEIDANEMKSRIEKVSKRFPWLVYEDKGNIIGYAYATEWKGRSAYRYSVESTIYLAPEATGQGVGSKLYGQLLECLKELKIHVAIGGISLPNAGSIALHEKMGFKKIGEFKEVGQKFGKWVDVGYWQLILPGRLLGSKV